jgi:hypothetical protein
MVCQLAFWVGGGVLWRRLGMSFIYLQWWILRVWYVDVWRRQWRWVGVVLAVRQFKRRILPLLLSAKDFNGILELCRSSFFPVDILSPCFSMLSYCLPSCDGFLLLTEPLSISCFTLASSSSSAALSSKDSSSQSSTWTWSSSALSWTA